MSNYRNFGKGLKMMCIAVGGMIVCSLFALIPLIRIFAIFGVMVFAIINTYGVFQAGKDVLNVRLSFYVQTVSIALSAYSGVIRSFGGSAFFSSTVKTILSIIAIYLIFSSICNVLGEHGKEELVKQGKRVMWTSLVGCLFVPVIEYLFLIEGGWVLLMLSLILPIVAFVLQIKIYKETAELFGAYL